MPSGFNLTILIEYQLIRRQKRTRGALFCLILGGEEEVKEETPFPIIFPLFCYFLLLWSVFLGDTWPGSWTVRSRGRASLSRVLSETQPAGARSLRRPGEEVRVCVFARARAWSRRRMNELETVCILKLQDRGCGSGGVVRTTVMWGQRVDEKHHIMPFVVLCSSNSSSNGLVFPALGCICGCVNLECSPKINKWTC